MTTDVSKTIEKSTIWPEIKKIMSEGVKVSNYELKGMIHTEKEDIAVIKILSIDTIKDFVNSIGDHLHLNFNIGLGDYAKRIYPYRNNLEFTVKHVPENSDKKLNKVKPIVKRYKAIFLKDENRKITGTDFERQSHENLNRMDVVSVKLQLLDVSLEVLRIMTVSGVYKNISQKELITSVLVGQSQKVIIGGKPSIDGIDIVAPDNKTAMGQIIIPDGTSISALPTFLHEKMGGVYNAGVGTYLQQTDSKKLWYVYPLYNVERFKENVKKLIFYSVPPDRFTGLDRTYRTESDITHILVSGGTELNDDAELEYMNKGVGFRTADAKAFMKKPIEITEKGPKGLRSNLNTEVINENRKDNLNYAPSSSKSGNSDRGISSNPYVDYTSVNSRNVARLDLVWENANLSLIHPGMPCKFMFLQVNKLVELKGIVLFAHSIEALQGNQASSRVFKNKCSLTVVLERLKTVPKVSTAKPHGRF